MEDKEKHQIYNELLDRLISAAYEEAAKVTCARCERGILAELVSAAECPPLAEVGSLESEDEPIYIHRRDDKQLFADFLCDAGNIRALKDSRTSSNSTL